MKDGVATARLSFIFELLSLVFELINIALFIIYNNLRGVRYCH